MKSSFRKMPKYLRSGKAIILVGYAIEARSAYGDPESTELFLDKAVSLHKSLGVPCTGFILGQTLLENIDAFKGIKDSCLWDIEQHTFSHVPFRDVDPAAEKKRSVKGASIDAIERDVSKANEVIREILGVSCQGISAPKGYFNGLKGRPDILKILQSNGISFVQSYGRNEYDWQPVPFEIQPFWYEEDGFSEILEIPIQGWQDTIWRRTFGWDNKIGFFGYVKESLDYVVENQLIWSCGFHDWSCIREDPELDIIKELFEYALKRSVIFMSHLEFFEMMKKEKDEYGCSFC